ncbi:hypothetical protein PRLR6014_25400 [Prevotella lacticifex]|nr:hypothetical protein PRLR6014_25400 [Prevotella lacticifex]
MPMSVEQHGANKTDITPSWNGYTFRIEYVDAEGNTTVYSPSASDGYTLTGTDTNSGKEKDLGNGSNTWKIEDNGGIYDLVVTVDNDGKPEKWYYSSDPNRIVAYKASSSSNWTTEGFLYCVKDKNSEATAYCKNFFGTIPMVKDEEFKFILGNYWFGKKEDSEIYDQNVSINGATEAPNLKNYYDGIYPVEFNPDRTDYQLSGKDTTPLRIFMIGSALNSSLSNTFTDWNPAGATELVYDDDEQCYKGTVALNKNGHFRFLRDKNASGPATSLELNFGEDANVPGKGGDTDANNHVAYNSKTSGTDVVFNPDNNIYNVRFYIEAGTAMDGFNWDNGKYRYTIELPTRLNATITPTTATVDYAASLTPKVSVVGTTSDEQRTYAFTIDGTNPTIDPATGKATGTTVVRPYKYDKVVPTDDVYTFFMSSDNKLTYIGTDKKEHTLDGNTVTVKAQAVQTVTKGSKYRLEGDIATGTYVFKTAGTAPAASYTISVVNDNKTDLASINKATATVTVLNKATNSDDGVDVYYTTNGSDPVAAGNPNSRLVRDRKITVYSIGNPDDINRIRVAIAGSKESDEDDGTTHASCTYDVTCSTSEGGYINYRDGYSDGKTLGGDGHIVVYVQPWSSDDKVSVATGDNPGEGRVPYIYAYENIDKDGVEVSKSLTNGHHIIDVTKDFALVQTVNPDEQWYYVDLVPDKGYKEVNVCMGYCDQDNSNTYTLTAATVANARNDMFLKYDVATGKIEDVTHAYTGDHFYTTGAGGTKSENANPGIGEHFFLAQVPVAWVINGNEVKVEKDNTVYSDATVVTQGAAETSDLSRVCKITVPTTLPENTPLTIRPYNGSEASNVGFEVNYKNGGYYFYESATHNTKDAMLVFAADTKDDSDKREYGHRDVNHVLDTYYGDVTQYLTPNWTYSPDTKTKEITVNNNWNGKTATVNTIDAGTTISQDVEGLDPGVYTVQMIVRGKSNAIGTLQLQGSEYTDEKGKIVGSTTGSDSKTFAGYDAQGTITTDGRVERLLKTETEKKNGWQKLETTATVGDEGKLTVSLKAEGEELQLSDVTLLCNANNPSEFPTVWTKAPTSSTVTEYNLTDRKNANDFSFFDRGDNSNAVIYADKNTVLGMSPNTYNVAVPTEYRSAKGGIVFHSVGKGTPNAKDFDNATGHKLAFDDNPGTDNWTNDNTWGTSKGISWSSFSWNRQFTGTASGSGERNTIFLPFKMSAEQIKGIFGENAKVYKIKSVNTDKLTVEGTEVTETNPNTPYILELPEAKDGVSYDGTLNTWISNVESIPTEIEGTQDYFVGVYKYTKFTSKSDGTYDYYGYDAERNGIFNFFSDDGADFKPWRAYLRIKTSAGSKPYYYFVIDEGGTTAIDSVSAAALTDDAPVYNLQGQLVRRAGQHTQLPKGLYIQKGRKFVQQ